MDHAACTGTTHPFLTVQHCPLLCPCPFQSCLHGLPQLQGQLLRDQPAGETSSAELDITPLSPVVIHSRKDVGTYPTELKSMCTAASGGSIFGQDRVIGKGDPFASFRPPLLTDLSRAISAWVALEWSFPGFSMYLQFETPAKPPGTHDETWRGMYQIV